MFFVDLVFVQGSEPANLNIVFLLVFNEHRMKRLHGLLSF